MSQTSDTVFGSTWIGGAPYEAETQQILDELGDPYTGEEVRLMAIRIWQARMTPEQRDDFAEMTGGSSGVSSQNPCVTWNSTDSLKRGTERAKPRTRGET